MGVRLLEDAPGGKLPRRWPTTPSDRSAASTSNSATAAFAPEGLVRAGFLLQPATTARSSILSQDEEAIYKGFSAKSCRYSIRKAERLGVVIEEARDDAFADEYYAQLVEVFANQGLTPTYGVARVRLLIKHLLPSGCLLLLRARDSEGRCIATGIFPGMNQMSLLLGERQLATASRGVPQRSAALVRHARTGRNAGFTGTTSAAAAHTSSNTAARNRKSYCFQKSKFGLVRMGRDLAFGCSGCGSDCGDRLCRRRKKRDDPE